ncbi:MAG: hypothetical protein A3J63_01565 [Candidatus Moranbacteria bacterium RIFCSPHIGHO2_02_FULL_40_12b]|nr:MAG: hypothetical protein A3J63_01565 [Candidatus Moranbacteria bacterium RIFCSPHIGHO2_02_FULL_40_12b]OGI23499.1 MAG: hypothetical protein A3E91_01815 [Candidatus Moranbacteria bacterium RIFCSPHIGHO2_12_FULL_40_10]
MSAKWKFNDLKNIPIYFIILTLILSIVIFLILISNFNWYRTDYNILLVAKSGELAKNPDTVIENFIELPRNLSFYEKILKDNDKIEDQFAGFSKDKRKRFWNDSLIIERKSGSGVIDLSVLAKSRSDSLELSKQTVNTLINYAGKFYNLRDDLDIRITDGPITSTYVKNWMLLISLSLIIGIVSSYLVYLINFKLFKGVPLYRKNFFERGLYQKQTEKTGGLREKMERRSSGRKYWAPENLPISEEIIGFPKSELPETKESAEQTLMKESAEPTEEEYKKRLNQLLRGGEM